MRILIAITALSVAGAALAQPSTPEPASLAPAGSSVPDDDLGTAPVSRRYDPLRVVCKRVRPPSGSRLVRDHGDERLCQTQEAWDRQSEAGREVLRDRDRGTCGSGGCTFSRQ